MTDEKEKRISELKELLEKYNEAYYDRDDPEISDAEYDSLMRELEELEGGNPSEDSPSAHVGGNPSAAFGAVTHHFQMKSLRDVFSYEEFEEWHEKAGNPKLCTEAKIDGLSCMLHYENGMLVQAATRGNGIEGEDVTDAAMKIKNIPWRIPIKEDLYVRCEIYMPEDAFEKANEELVAAGKKPFQNRRNAAAGSLRAKDPDTARRRGLKAAAFQMLSDDAALPTLQSARLALLFSMGFSVPEHAVCMNVTEAEREIRIINDKRNALDYPIDGAVLKIDSIPSYTSYGETEKYPHWAVAYKYPPETTKTTLRRIVLQTGRTGVITPVAEFDTVMLSETRVSRATLHNQEFMDSVLGGIAPGDTVTVMKSGEIIPEITHVDKSSRPNGMPDFRIETCPVCGAPAVLGTDENGNGGTQMFCSNPDCPAKLELSLVHWCSRNVMHIDGIGPSAAHALTQAGLSGIPDLYVWPEEQFAETLGAGRATNIMKNIETSRHLGTGRLIAGLGIPGIGRKIGDALEKAYPDMASVMSSPEEELASIPGIGSVSATVLCRFFASNAGRKFITDLSAGGVNMKSLTYGTDAPAGPLSGLSFCITGTLTVPRSREKAMLESLGAEVTGTVSKKTSFLLAGYGGGAKRQKAESLGIPVISQEELEEMIKNAS